MKNRGIKEIIVPVKECDIDALREEFSEEKHRVETGEPSANNSDSKV
jgi:hypothetical protein